MRLSVVLLCFPLIAVTGAFRSHDRDVDFQLPTETCDFVAEGGRICTPNACTYAKCSLIPDAFCVSDKCGCRARFHLFVTEHDGYRDITGLCSAFEKMEVAKLSFKNALYNQESAVSFLSTAPETQKKFFQGLDQFIFEIVKITVGYLKTVVERKPISANVKLYAAAVTELRRLRSRLHQSGLMLNGGITTKIPIPVAPEGQSPFVENEWTTAITRPPTSTTSAPATTRATTTTTIAPIRSIGTISKPTTSFPPPKPAIQFAAANWFVLNQSNADKMDANNAFVDSNGRLHLRLTKRGSSWRCAGLKSVQPFGYGRYEYHIESRLDSLDPNIVFALFSQADNQPGIGIQFARWGEEDAKPASYGVSRRRLPAPFLAGATSHHAFTFGLTGTYTTHSYNWNDRSVVFGSQHDHQNNTKNLEFQKWTYAPRNSSSIPQSPAPVTMCWCTYASTAPISQKDMEIIVHNFKFYPKPRGHIVKSGDTLSKIAEKFGTTWQKIVFDNKIVNPDTIFPGQVLVIH